MTFPVSFLLAFLGLVTSAHVRVAAVLFGYPVSTSLLGLIFAVAVLGLAVAVLVLLRAVVRDGLWLRRVSRNIA